MMCLSNGIKLETATATVYLSMLRIVVREGGMRMYGGEGGRFAKSLKISTDGNTAGFIETSDPSGCSPRDSPL